MTDQIESYLFETKKAKSDPQWRARQKEAIQTLDGALNKIRSAESKRAEYRRLAELEKERVRAEKESIADATDHFLMDAHFMLEEGRVGKGFAEAVERLQWKIASYLDPKRFG